MWVEELAMATRTVDIAEAQASLPDLVVLVNAGVEVVLTRDSAPVACLVPMAPLSAKRVAGLHPGAVRASDDFDEPLSDEFWTGKG
jgi:antitoxin (DNA-binding transcriptional repressor) of toxin-antitoxin stability system